MTSRDTLSDWLYGGKIKGVSKIVIIIDVLPLEIYKEKIICLKTIIGSDYLYCFDFIGVVLTPTMNKEGLCSHNTHERYIIQVIDTNICLVITNGLIPEVIFPNAKNSRPENYEAQTK